MSRDGTTFELPRASSLMADMFTTQEQRDDMKKERVETIEISKLASFENHPFKVAQDEELQKLVESIRENGVLYPAIARPKGNGYELISGHRRKIACELLGLETMPVFVRYMTNEQAVITMVDSNLQRENILPSEKAFAYKMKLEAIKSGGAQLGHLQKSRDLVAENSDDSREQIRRYIRLTELVPELLQMVDDGKIAFTPAVELSYLTEQEQQNLLETINSEACTPSLSQAQRLKKLSQEGGLDMDAIFAVMREPKANQSEKLSFKTEELKSFFPNSYSTQQMQEVILRLLKQWKERQRDKDAR